MIKKLSIKHFKSIREMELDCRRVNLFIGRSCTMLAPAISTIRFSY